MNAPLTPDQMRLLQAAAVATDIDPGETAEWREAYAALIEAQGPERARWMLDDWLGV